MKFYFLSAFSGCSTLCMLARPNFAAPVAPTPKPNFTSKSYGFSAWFPKPPQKGTRTQNISKTSTLKVEYFFTPPAPVAYIVMPLALPTAPAKLPLREFYDVTQNGFLSASGVKLVARKEVSLSGKAARELTYRVAGRTGQTRFLRIGRRSFQLTIIAPDAQFARFKAQNQRFFAAFSLAKP